MSIARIVSRAQIGLMAPAVLVEVHLGSGLPCFNVVGLLATEVKESKERVRAALSHSGFELPAGRITVNLAPADLPKDGGRFDLAIALGVLIASGQLRPARDMTQLECFAELSLDGQLRSVRGVLPAAVAAGGAAHEIIVALQGQHELAALAGVRGIACSTLLEVCQYLEGQLAWPTEFCTEQYPSQSPSRQLRLADVRGQLLGKRALEVAAAGCHSVLFVGPPGCGKSMLAARLPGLLPPLEKNEALEVAMIASVAAGNRNRHCNRSHERPFRAPHHSASASAIIGGGPRALPGEITLAHCGVLFLDELPEFDRRVLESLREPLETGEVSIVRAGARADYPARFQFVAAMNPCPCGQRGSGARPCRCTAAQVDRYLARLSGPLLDRIDLRIALEPVSEAELAESPASESVAEAAILERVNRAHRCQRERQNCSNAHLGIAQLAEVATPDSESARLLARMRAQLGLSMRSQHRLLRVARTLADLAGRVEIAAEDIAEAASLRRALG
jgi:magnesium chelatase family protein